MVDDVSSSPQVHAPTNWGTGFQFPESVEGKYIEEFIVLSFQNLMWEHIVNKALSHEEEKG